MADIPVPRSLQQILGDMQDSFISRTGISSLKVGSPIVSILESVAQSQLRDSQDVFTLLASVGLDKATGAALDAIAAEEGLVRKGATASTGSVTVTDTAITKVQTYLQSEVAVAANSIRVFSANGIAQNDSVYIGYGTAREELIQVTQVTSGSGDTYFDLTLLTPTTKSHFSGEIVLKSQGGDRIVSAGTSLGVSPKFTVNQTYSIPDGFGQIENVQVVCGEVGTKGNVGYDTIKKVNTKLTFDATVSNPLPFTNGFDEETDDKLRLRVRLARSNKQRATAASVVNSVIGATSTDDNKTIASASLIQDAQTGKATIYVDDGNGYEATYKGISYEVLESYANGGEQYFALQGGRPIAPPFVISEKTGPFDVMGTTTISVGDSSGTGTRKPLIVFVGDTTGVVDFPDTFPQSATALDVVAAINDTSNLLFKAFSYNNRSQVMLVPNDGVSTIRVASDPIQNGGAASFGFPANQASIIYISKDGNLLTFGDDYYLDRERGTIALVEPLKSGEKLLVVAPDIRPVLTSTLSVNSAVPSSQYRYMWLSVDDKSASTPVSLKKDASVTVSTLGNIKTITAATGTFANARAGDWLILADEQVVANSKPWTERILEAGSTYIKICQTGANVITDGTKTLASDDAFVIARCETAPQKVSLTDTWTSFDGMLELASVGLTGVTAYTVGAGSSQKNLAFRSDRYTSDASLKVLCVTTEMQRLLGFSKGDSQEAVSGVFPTYSLDSSSDTSSPTFLYRQGYPVAANWGEIFKGVATSEVSSVGNYLYATDQGLVKTYGGTTAGWNYKLNEVPVSSDIVTSYTGFQFGGSDALSLYIDALRDDSYSVALNMYKDAYLTSNGGDSYRIAALSGEVALTTSLGSLDMSDFALWTNPASANLISRTDTVSFTSKLMGKDSQYRRVELVYATSPNQPSSDKVVDGGVVQVTIASGASRNPQGTSNKVFLRSSVFTNNAVDLEFAPAWEYHDSAFHSTSTNYFYINKIDYPDLDSYVSQGDTLTVAATGLNGTVTVNTVKTQPDDASLWNVEVGTGLSFTASSDGPFPVSIGSINTSLGTSVAEGDKVSFDIGSGTILVGKIVTLHLEEGYVTLLMESSNVNPTYKRFVSSPNLSVFPNNPSLFSDGTFEYVTPESGKSVFVQTASTAEFENFASLDDVGKFSGGVDYISTSTVNGNDFVVDVKLATSTPTIGNCKIVPVTSKNVVNLINNAYADVGVLARMSQDRKVQISRSETGSDRSVQVTGGTANSVSAKSTSVTDERTITATLTGSSISVGSKVLVEQAFPTKLAFTSVPVGSTIGTNKLVTLGDATTDFGGYLWNLWDWNNDLYSGRSNRDMDKMLAWNMPWRVVVDGNYVGFFLDNGSLLNQYDATGDSTFDTLFTQVRVGSTVKVVKARFPISSVNSSTIVVDGYYRSFSVWKAGLTVKNYNKNETRTITSIDENTDSIVFTSSVSGWGAGDLVGPDDSMDAGSFVGGVYRIVSVNPLGYSFWIENGSGTSEWTSTAHLCLTTLFYATNSIMKGDSFQYIKASNSSTFDSTVASIPDDFGSLVGLLNNETLAGRSDARSKVSLSTAPQTTITTENGDILNFVKSSTASIIDTIGSITVSSVANSTYTLTLANAGLQDPYTKQYSLQRLFGTDQGSQYLTVSSTSKLSLPTSTLFGNDAYNYYTGLIGEANKIIFGDAQDPIKYSGFASLNASIDIMPPNIKQVKAGLLVRMSSGYSLRDVVQNVQASVAAFVNSIPIGQNVPYSGIIASASLVAGVISVVVVDSAYGAPTTSGKSDVITVKSDHKPLVLSLTDITVTQI